ncbi:O-antigen ligase family protein [Butyrivibrio sp. VCB2006]|uniref:O-antigen ligase family protein n=1 Tax=Butyrivibrio sp. VCB2006 TaxID=1280679 RepID=UPI00041E4CE4|nr:O-antigen ligase family protein [Butyrivibrio sp. VCB2006]
MTVIKSEIAKVNTEKSKYLKAPREKTIFYRVAVFYLFALYIMPQYFGIPNPIFDLTTVRVGIIFLLIFIICDYDRSVDFVSMIKQEKMSLVLLPYMFVLIYTMVLRADINAFLNPFIEILEMYLMIYVIRDSLGVDRAYKLVLGFLTTLIILGFYESFTHKSPFFVLMTIDNLPIEAFVRGGHYRVMSSCVHSLGYGLLLIAAMPFVGYDVEKKEYNILRRPLLLIGVIVNIFMTGSRSSLGIMFGELFLMLILSERKYFRQNMFYLTTSITLFAIVVFALQKTSFGEYVLLQLTSVIDSVFGTTYSIKYGADMMALTSSSAYRDQLKGIFRVTWLNPILGYGRKRAFSGVVEGHVIKSIDNYYIAEYIRYAYPGMFAYIFFLVYMGIKMLVDMYRTRSALIRAMFIAGVCYALHLYIADSLQTLKYLYIIIAFYLCADKTPYVPPEGKSKYIGKRVSKYVKK